MGVMIMTAPESISGLSELAADYDALFLDIWGCVHDGLVLYPGVKQALAQWRKQGGKVVLVSNVPKGGEVVIRQLQQKGLARQDYDALVTSGMATEAALQHDPALAGQPCFVLCGPQDESRDDPAPMLGFTHPIVPVPHPADAGFGLLIGKSAPGVTVADYIPKLEACLEAGLELVCLNPDHAVMRGSSTLICAGAIAAHYEKMGGRIRYFGKPHAPIYEAALTHLPEVPKRRILAVGDGPITDICGANRMNLPACFIAGGLHAHALLTREGHPDLPAVQQELSTANCHAAYVMAELAW